MRILLDLSNKQGKERGKEESVEIFKYLKVNSKRKT